MTQSNEEKLKQLQKIIADTAIHYSSETQKIMSPTGKTQKWLIDLRPVLLNVEALDIITDIFWDRYESQLPFQIGGMEVAAVPLVTALLMKAKQRGLDTSGFVIRKERKKSGLGKIIEGTVSEHPIIIVDDIMNSGTSLEKSRVFVEQEGRKVDQVFVIINYEARQGQHWAKQNKVKVDQLFTLDQFDVEYNHSSFKAPKFQYKVLWRFLEKGAFPFHVVPKSTPLLVNHKIYMGTEAGFFVCVDASNGEALWKYDVKTHHPKGIWSSPAYHNGRVYFGAYNGIAYGLDAETGEEIWKNSCCEFIGSSPLLVPKHNMMYLGLEHQRPRMMGSNAAFNMETGERVWERPQEKYQHGSASYYAPKDYVVFGNANHDVTAYEAKTGKIAWEYKTDRSSKYPPAIDEELKLVVATSFDGNIYCLDVETGELKAAIQTNDICYTTPLITHGKIFAGSGDRFFYIIDAHSFEVLKKIDCYARVFSSPRLIDGQVIFGTGGGRIIELDPDNLEITSDTLLPDAVTNAVSASPNSDVLYAATCMNELYAISRTPINYKS
jgi:orotate phosphoribosyltransferase